VQKPDFGIGKLFAIKWTTERVSYLRYLAEQKLSAADIAVDIGLGKAGASRVAEAARTNGIKLQGKPGRRPAKPLPLLVGVPAEFVPALERLGAKYRRTPADIAQALIAAIFDQGETFLDNLLDLDGTGE
jgi:hypothetical protein